MYAQEIVSGIVVDSKNEPMPGVRVEIVDRTEVTTTDIDGKFRIELPVAVKKIRLTYPGYKPIIKKVKPDMVIKMGNGWSAQSSGFRGFVDIQGGFGFGGSVNVLSGDCLVRDIHTKLSFGLIETLGYQINSNLFVGAGTGWYLDCVYSESVDYWNTMESNLELYALRIPIFGAVRWDFGLDRKTAPYVELKAGYQFNKVEVCDDSDYYLASSYSDNGYVEISGRNTGSFFLQPSVGYRVGIGSKMGMNLGLSYCVSVPKKLYAVTHYYVQNEYEESMTELGTSRGGVFMFNIGFDF